MARGTRRPIWLNILDTSNFDSIKSTSYLYKTMYSLCLQQYKTVFSWKFISFCSVRPVTSWQRRQCGVVWSLMLRCTACCRPQRSRRRRFSLAAWRYPEHNSHSGIRSIKNDRAKDMLTTSGHSFFTRKWLAILLFLRAIGWLFYSFYAQVAGYFTLFTRKWLASLLFLLASGWLFYSFSKKGFQRFVQFCWFNVVYTIQ